MKRTFVAIIGKVDWVNINDIQESIATIYLSGYFGQSDVFDDALCPLILFPVRVVKSPLFHSYFFNDFHKRFML